MGDRSLWLKPQWEGGRPNGQLFVSTQPGYSTGAEKPGTGYGSGRLHYALGNNAKLLGVYEVTLKQSAGNAADGFIFYKKLPTFIR